MPFSPTPPAWLKAQGPQGQQVLCPRLVGRDLELDALRCALSRARGGRGGLAVVLGEAGVGKSRLAAELKAVAANDGCAVLTGRAVQGQSPVAFRPLTEALRSGFRATGPPEGEELAPFRAALGRLVPEWRQKDAPRSDDFLLLLGEAVLRLLSVAAGSSGGLVILEDLHWADPDTLVILEYLADNLDAERVLCLATIRTEEPGPAFGLAASLAARRAARVLELDRLGAPEIEEMARACLGAASVPEGLTGALTAWTEGVPFLIEELLASWIGSGVLGRVSGEWWLGPAAEPIVPVSFSQTVLRRVAALGGDGRPVLSAAAALGRSFDWRLLSKMVDLDERAVLAVLRRGLAAQLLVAEGPPSTDRQAFCFRHALTRDAVLGNLLPPERVEVLRRALRAVEEAHPGFPGAWCERAVDLAEAAGDVGCAARLLLLSGRRALAQGALATAEEALERGRGLAGCAPGLAVEIDETLTEVLAFAAKSDRAIEVGHRLLCQLEAQPGPSPVRRAAAHVSLARAVIPSGNWPVVLGQLERARRLAEDCGDVSLLASIDAIGAHVAVGEARLDDAHALARGALDVAERAGLPEVACEALEVIGRCARLWDLDEAERSFEQAYRIAQLHGLTLWRIRALHELALLDMLIRLRPDRLREARDLAYKAGALATAADLDLHVATVLAFRFAAMPGLVAARRCADSARRLHLGLLLPMALLRQAECHAIAGDRDQMEEAVTEALLHGRGDSNVAAGVWGQCRGLHSLLEDNPARALGHFDRAMDLVRDEPGSLPWIFRGLWLVVHAFEDRDAEATQAEFEASAVMARPIHRGFLGYARAVTLGRRGQPDAAGLSFAAGEAEMAVGGGGGPGQLARRMVAEAAMGDGWGTPEPWLHEAATFFDHSGHARLGSRSRALLRTAGVPVPRRRRMTTDLPAGLASLGITRREAEVLALVADRLGNAEIASRLFVSPRTVHKHMQHLMAKTGLHQRRQLAAWAASAGDG